MHSKVKTSSPDCPACPNCGSNETVKPRNDSTKCYCEECQQLFSVATPEEKSRVSKVQHLPAYIHLGTNGPHKEPHDWESFRVHATDSRNGEHAGDVKFVRDLQEGGPWYAKEVMVPTKYRRQGIASAMYNLARTKLGKIAPSEMQTGDGEAFWNGQPKSLSFRKSAGTPARSIEDVPDLPGIKKAVIAVDLHGTLGQKLSGNGDPDLVNGGYSEYDPAGYVPQEGAAEAMVRLRRNGHDVIVWTCLATADARKWLLEHDIPFDGINEEGPNHGSVKVDADAYIDDKAVHHAGDWDETLALLAERLVARPSLKSVRVKCDQGPNKGKPGPCPGNSSSGSETGGEDDANQAAVKEEPASKLRQPPGSQLPSHVKERLRSNGMTGTFPPADVPLDKIKVHESTAEELQFKPLMQWEQVTKSGRVSRQYRYTQAFHDRNATQKFERVMAVEPHLAKARTLLQDAMTDSYGTKNGDAAAIASIIMETGLRPTDGDDSIAHGHYGIASLLGNHVKIKGGKAYLDFVGKEGVRNLSTVTDPKNVAYFKAKLQQVGPDQPLWNATSDHAGDALKKAVVANGGPADVKLKDLRTVKATQTARQVTEQFPGPPPPLSGDAKKDTKVLSSAIMKMSGDVAKVLNNTPVQARDNYIHPEVWKQWQDKLSQQATKRSLTKTTTMTGRSTSSTTRFQAAKVSLTSTRGHYGMRSNDSSMTSRGINNQRRKSCGDDCKCAGCQVGKGNPFGTHRLASDVTQGRFVHDTVTGKQVRVLGGSGDSVQVGTADMGRPLGLRTEGQLRECDQWGRAAGPYRAKALDAAGGEAKVVGSRLKDRVREIGHLIDGGKWGPLKDYLLDLLGHHPAADGAVAHEVELLRNVAQHADYLDGAQQAADMVEELERKLGTKCFKSADEATSDADEDVALRANLLADLLGGTFGDDVLGTLDAEEVGKGKGEPCKRGERASSSGCIPANKPTGSKPKPGADVKQSAKDAVKAAHGHPASKENVGKLLDHLSKLSVKELHALKQELGLKASGKTKQQLAAKLADRVGGGKQSGGEDSKPSESKPRTSSTDASSQGARASKARIQIGDQAKGIAKGWFGSKFSDSTIPSLVGAPDDAGVRVRAVAENELEITVMHKDYTATRKMGRDDDGNLFIENDTFVINEGAQGNGLGMRVFGDQVANAISHGVAYIKCHAGNGPGLNGYYTWPRFGYDQSIVDLEESNWELHAQVQQKFPDAKSVLDVMKTPEGRDWWKENGDDLYKAEFDLAEGSRSREVFSAYKEERAKRGKSYRLKNNAEPKHGVEEPDLSPSDEQALAEAWQKIDEEGLDQ